MTGGLLVRSMAAMPERKIRRTGRYYEDFNVGDTYRHHWGRTLTEGECVLFTTSTQNANPLYFNREYARALGHPTCPANPLLVMNVVFGMTVEDLSEQALARYRMPENQAARLADQRAPAWVFLTGMKLNLSSTGLRNSDGSWKAKK